MLACKRGHERCAEVLVSMGAEIYMVDRRGRTARDTATRRNHFGLLRWLTTQAQVSRVQECHARQRAIHLIEMRRAYQEGRLVLNSTDSFMQTLVTAIQSTIPKGEQPLFTQRALTYSNVEKMRSFRSIISDFGQAHPAGQPTIEHIKKLITEQDIRELTPVYRKDDRLSKKFPGYEEWQWPLILYK